MHAFLINSPAKQDLALPETNKLAERLQAKILEFPIQKIEDARNLNKLLRLSFNEKTLIVCRDIQNATEEALNAFLKNLEEPQENIYFALTTTNISQVLPTIVSRCQIIKGERIDLKVKSEFLDMNKTQRLDFVSKIKERDIAINFVTDLIYYLHSEKIFDNMELLLKTRTRLNASGNVNLQLSNLAINYKD